MSSIPKPLIALYRPQIPPNTGNIARLCVALATPLAIVGKAAFTWDEKQLRRAGLDHWQDLHFRHFPRWRDFAQEMKERRVIAITKVGEHSLFDFGFAAGDILLFGNETAGLPPSLLCRLSFRVRLPMWGPVRSLNLSNAVAVTAYEYFRQMYVQGFSFSEQHPQRTWYRRLVDRQGG